MHPVLLLVLLLLVVERKKSKKNEKSSFWVKSKKPKKPKISIKTSSQSQGRVWLGRKNLIQQLDLVVLPFLPRFQDTG